MFKLCWHFHWKYSNPKQFNINHPMEPVWYKTFDSVRECKFCRYKQILKWVDMTNNEYTYKWEDDKTISS